MEEEEEEKEKEELNTLMADKDAGRGSCWSNERA